MESNGPGDSGDSAPSGHLAVIQEPEDDPGPDIRHSVFTADDAGTSAAPGSGSGVQFTPQAPSTAAHDASEPELYPLALTPRPSILRDLGDHPWHRMPHRDVGRSGTGDHVFGGHIPVPQELEHLGSHSLIAIAQNRGRDRRAPQHAAGHAGPIRQPTGRTHGQGPAALAIPRAQRHHDNRTAISQGPAPQAPATVANGLRDVRHVRPSGTLSNDSRFSAEPSFLRPWNSTSNLSHTGRLAYAPQPQAPAAGSTDAPRIPKQVPPPVARPGHTLPIGHAARFFPQPSQATGPPVTIVPSQGPPPTAAVAAPQPILLPTDAPPNHPLPGHPQRAPAPIGQHTTRSNPPTSETAAHPGLRVFECAVCRDRFDTRAACQTHILVQHVIPAFLNTCSRIPQNVRELPPPAQ